MSKKQKISGANSCIITMETVDVEDESQYGAVASNDIIDLDEVCNDDVVEVVDLEEVDIRKCLGDTFNQLGGFENFLHECFKVDCSTAMLRIVNRTLIPLYKANGSSFNSPSDVEHFNSALTRALTNIKLDPLHRYSHIKELCEVVKYLKKKMKVPAAKKKKHKSAHKKKKSNSSKDKSHRKKARIDTNIINIDDDEFEVPIINLDEGFANNSVEVVENENAGANTVAVNQRTETVKKQYVEITIPHANIHLGQVLNESGDSPNYVETVSSTTDYLPENSNADVCSPGNQNMKDVIFQTDDSSLEVTRTSDADVCSSGNNQNMKDISFQTVDVTKTCNADLCSSGNNQYMKDVIFQTDDSSLEVTRTSDADVCSSGNNQNMKDISFQTVDVTKTCNADLCSSGNNQYMKDVSFQTDDSLLEVTRSSPQKITSNVGMGISVKTVHSSTAVLINKNTDKTTTQQSVESMEREIKFYKNLIDRYNVAEVTEDNPLSPYIQCENFQKKIVSLYEKLCHLKGRPSVKRREVRLHAIDSRPELPIKKLETLINTNIGSDGMPHFPDLEEVIYCVKEANFEGNLGWDNKQIMIEARALFVHCGRALQRKRQKREWRDLMSLVKDESLEDPADKDPVLEARLHMNRLIAKSKEFDMLEKYSSMAADTLPETYGDESLHDDERGDDVTNEDGNVEQIQILSVASCHQAVNNVIWNTSENENCDVTNKQTNDSELTNLIQTQNDSTVNKTDEQSEVIKVLNSKTSNIQVVSIETFDDFDTNNNEGNISNVVDSYNKDDNCNSISDKENQMEKDVSQHHLVKSENLSNSQTENKETINVLQIKRMKDGVLVPIDHTLERQEIKSENMETQNALFHEMDSSIVKSENTIRELNELGDDFTVTILNVIDPFLIIEISSDSETEDENDDEIPKKANQ